MFNRMKRVGFGFKLQRFEANANSRCVASSNLKPLKKRLSRLANGGTLTRKYDKFALSKAIESKMRVNTDV
jgi:hypothetical protein